MYRYYNIALRNVAQRSESGVLCNARYNTLSLLAKNTIPMPISGKKLIRSFHHAFSGLKAAFISEQNFRIMTGAAVISFAIIFLKPMPVSHRAALALAAALLLIAELINTAMEEAMDVLSKNHLEEIRKIKDIMAGAALIASCAWALVIMWVFFA